MIVVRKVLVLAFACRSFFLAGKVCCHSAGRVKNEGRTASGCLLAVFIGRFLRATRMKNGNTLAR